EAIVILVAVTMQNAGLELTAHATLWPHRTAAQFCTQDQALRANVTRSFQPAIRMHLRPFIDEDRSAPRVRDYERLDARRPIDQHLIGRTNHRQRGRQRRLSLLRAEMLPVIAKYARIVFHEVPGIAHHGTAGDVTRKSILPGLTPFADGVNIALRHA